MSEAQITKPNIKKLWGKSGGRCAICKTEITETPNSCEQATPLIGVMAHICGEKGGPGSHRYDSSIIDKEKNSESNLMVLCPTCHAKIDNDEKQFTVEKLLEIKKSHEIWVQDGIREQMSNVTFAELEVTIGYLVNNTNNENDSEISFIKPKDKIAKNNLTADIDCLITSGMARVSDVKNYLSSNPDMTFAERLRSQMISKYKELQENEKDANAIFYELLKYASHNSRDPKMHAAALSVVVYFFEVCDIFEK